MAQDDASEATTCLWVACSHGTVTLSFMEINSFDRLRARKAGKQVSIELMKAHHLQVPHWTQRPVQHIDYGSSREALAPLTSMRTPHATSVVLL